MAGKKSTQMKIFPAFIYLLLQKTIRHTLSSGLSLSLSLHPLPSAIYYYCVEDRTLKDIKSKLYQFLSKPWLVTYKRGKQRPQVDEISNCVSELQWLSRRGENYNIKTHILSSGLSLAVHPLPKHAKQTLYGENIQQSGRK